MDEKVKVSCPHCGATNNFPLTAEGKTVVCGRCRAPLPVPGTVLAPDASELEVLIRNAHLPVLADLYSDTCMPCRAMKPIVQRLAERRRGELMVVEVRIEDHMDFAAGLGVQGVPTFIVFSGGFERGRISGAMSEADLGLWVASQT
jgi:thioredoxin 2